MAEKRDTSSDMERKRVHNRLPQIPYSDLPTLKMTNLEVLARKPGNHTSNRKTAVKMGNRTLHLSYFDVLPRFHRLLMKISFR